MELIFAAKALSSMSFLFFFGSYAALLFKYEPQLFPAFALICLGLFLCCIFDMKINPRARYIPLILVFLSALWIKDIASLAIIAVCIVYGVIMIAKQAYFLTYGEGVDEFKRNIKIVLFLLFTSIVFGVTDRLGTSVLPFTIIYMISAVCELSMLRHNDETLREKRFRILNSSILGATCLLGFFMATDLFMKFCTFVLRLFVDYIFSPIMMAVTTVSSYLLLGFTSLLEDTVFEMMKSRSGKGLTFENLSGLVDDNKFTGERGVLDVVMYIVVALLVVLVLFLFFRKLFKSVSQRTNRPAGETRVKEYIPRPTYDEDLSNEVKGIRNVYRKFLNLLMNRGMDIPMYYTTEDVNGQITNEIPDREQAHQLREYYIRARYGEKELSKADLQHAKQLYSDMKKRK